MDDGAIDAGADTEPVTLTIDRIGARGDGVAHTDVGPVYVDGALAGEQVRARVRGDRAVVIDVITPSPARVDPACRHVAVCGGCALQHWRQADYQHWKRARVVDALARVELDAPVGDLVHAAGAGRRRATLHAVRAKAVGFVFGYSERASARVFDLAECPVLAPPIVAAVPRLRALSDMLLPKAGRLDIHVNMTAAGLDIDIRGGAGRTKTGDTPDVVAAIAEAAEAGDWARVTRAGAPVLIRRTPHVDINGVRVSLPPAAFLQATAQGEGALSGLVLGAVGSARRVMDLYSGWGAFALRLAKSAEVKAFESDTAAVNALKQAARQGSGLKPLVAHTRDLARNSLAFRELNWAQAVVVDPPRAGAAAQMRQIAHAKIETVAAVSCNPTTFARDAKTLVEGGFKLEKVTPVDQFIWSAHVELVGVFRR